MTLPYLLVADLHFHQWSAFSTVNSDGINSRLQIILDELLRAADELEGVGGHTIIFAGDLFHVRGSIDPEVFNPVHQAIENLSLRGFTIFLIPGNHDLKGRDTTELGNAFQSLAALGNVKVVTRPALLGEEFPAHTSLNVAMIPWCGAKDKLREAVNELRNTYTELDEVDLIIHAGIDGFLTGVPDHGLTAAEVASWGFKRVFAGDYHNHKIMEGGKVVSIGATTHQTWSDIGGKAGFLLVYPDRVDYRASHAPSFVEITGDTDEAEIPLIVDGNYVRCRSMKLTDGEVKAMREELTRHGARGVMFQTVRETVSARTGNVTGSSVTLDETIANYVDTLTGIDAVKIKAICADVLMNVRSIAA